MPIMNIKKLIKKKEKDSVGHYEVTKNQMTQQDREVIYFILYSFLKSVFAPKQTKPQHQETPLECNLTVQNLKDDLKDFLKLEPEKQRNILGELLYPKILRRSRPEHAPKITGMLVDFEVLSVQDILEMLENDNILGERIDEAQELIMSEGQ